MKQEEKDLLLKYLCAALPYEVKILHEGWNYEWDDELSTVERVVGIDENFIYTKVIDTHNGEEYREDKHSIDIFDDKPYLRSMSSMTEEEAKEIAILHDIKDILSVKVTSDYIDVIVDDGVCSTERRTIWYDEIVSSIECIYWLLEHHFDFMGLIPKNLAIEVTKDNNPYKD